MADPVMRRVVFDVRMPNWLKYGVVAYVSSDEDLAEQTDAHYAGGVVTVTSDRPATAQELARYADYQAWLVRWIDEARLARAGWHMANPCRSA